MEKQIAGERIAKVIARSGACSRREAERLIEAGKVTVDGKRITSPALNVTDENVVIVNGEPLAAKEEAKLWLFHKPKGCLTTTSDPQGRKTVFEIIPKSLPRVISVGRLDYNTEGLLLLTNSGALARHLELPSTGWIRRYKVRAYGKIDNNKLDLLRAGAEIDGIKYAPAKIELEKTQGENNWMIISIAEGKNREIRRMLDFANLEVNRLIRTSYGPFQLGSLPPREVKQISGKVIKEQINFGSVSV